MSSQPVSSSTSAPIDSIDRPPMFDRETSWLRFNRRVLEETWDAQNPPLERLRFLSIFHTNLDEFFMIRVSGLKQQVAAGVEVLSRSGLSPRQQLLEVGNEVREALTSASACLHAELLPSLAQHGICVTHYHELKAAERAWWDGWYLRHVHPILTPLAISSAFPFPFISNLSLNLAVYVESEEDGRRLARIKVPDRLERLIDLDGTPQPSAEDPARFLPLEELIAANLGTLFPGRRLSRAHAFRVTRDADVEIKEDEADDLLKYLEEELRKRRFGEAVRLEIDTEAPAEMVAEIQAGLHLAERDTYRVTGMMSPAAVSRLVGLDLPALKWPPFAPRIRAMSDGTGIFAAIRAQGEVLLHHPFDAFAAVAEFVRQAARDPQVLAIKQTLYRTSGDSPIVTALLEAVERGKQVAAVVELKARFDEENNIVWARRLEEAGVHVICGVPGLKTHAKLCLVVREEEGQLHRYVHIGTGNYNGTTARVYTDIGLFSCDEDLTADVADLFNRITGFGQPIGYRKAFVAPRFMRERLLSLIHHERDEALAGRPGQIIAKCNAITEKVVIAALYEASQAGVQIDLLIRGMCCLIPGRPGMSDNIRVRSVVGRFLEHSRVYWFRNGEAPQVYIGSADWMGRNLNRRIEILAPIQDPAHKSWIRDVYLEAYLSDVQRTRVMQPDGSFVRLRDSVPEGPDVHLGFLAEVQDDLAD